MWVIKKHNKSLNKLKLFPSLIFHFLNCVRHDAYWFYGTKFFLKIEFEKQCFKHKLFLKALISIFKILLSPNDLYYYIFIHTHTYICVQLAKKKRKTPINSNTNYRREIKLIPINMDYCLLQFDAVKFFLGVHLHG